MPAGLGWQADRIGTVYMIAGCLSLLTIPLIPMVVNWVGCWRTVHWSLIVLVPIMTSIPLLTYLVGQLNVLYLMAMLMLLR